MCRKKREICMCACVCVKECNYDIFMLCVMCSVDSNNYKCIGVPKPIYEYVLYTSYDVGIYFKIAYIF